MAHGPKLILDPNHGGFSFSFVPWSKVAILGMVIPPFNRNPYNGYINPYYWVDDHPLLYGNNGSLDPGTFKDDFQVPGIRFLVNKGFPMLQSDTRGFQSATLTLQNFQRIHADL